MKPAVVLLVIAGAWLLSSCQSRPAPGSPPVTAAKVDVDRYLGRWHEVARLPMPFQQEGEAAIAEYGRNADGTVSVRNIAVREDGVTREVRGKAKVLNPGTNTKLTVRFMEWFGLFIPEPEQGNYWILHIDPGYQRAVVGTPNRRYLWILSRTRGMPAKELQELTDLAGKRGYDVGRLIKTPQHVPKG